MIWVKKLMPTNLEKGVEGVTVDEMEHELK